MASCEPCRSRSASPGGGSQPVTWVRTTPQEKTAIVLNGGGRVCGSSGGGGKKNLSICVSPSNELNVVFPAGKRSSGGGCISISGGGSGLQISLDAQRSVLQLGPPSGCAAKLYGCDSKVTFVPPPRGGGAIVSADGRCVQLNMGRGGMQVSIAKGARGASQIRCGGSGGAMEITYGMTELGKEIRLAQCNYKYLHPFGA